MSRRLLDGGPCAVARRLSATLPSACIVAAIVVASAGSRPSTAAEAVGTSLPIEAQYAVSTAIGRDDSRYYALDTAAGVVLENPAQSLRLVFSHEGATLQADSLVWQMGLVSWGVGDASESVERSDPVSSGNRVEVDHGGVTEWYVNGPFGLQQGFTVAVAPGQRDGTPLALRLATPDGLTARIDPDGRGLAWCDPNGTVVLSYTGLLAVDARGEPLPAWLESRGDSLVICVNEAEATYPLTIDPWVQMAKLTASDGAEWDYFGGCVAIDGDTVVVGAYHDDIDASNAQGSAYVFVKPGSGWATTSGYDARLTASDGAALDYFGGCVAIDGDTIVVGADGHDIDAKGSQGSAYVFVKPGSGWATGTETARLTASDGATEDRFGISVAIDGDTVVVGAYGDDGAKGSAYVFVEPGGGWTDTTAETAKLTASDRATYDRFGCSVAISGDTVVVGAREDDDNGSAYLFEKGGGWATTSTYDAKLTASGGEASDEFGCSVAIDGDTVVVGAYGDDSERGLAYVFEKGGGWDDMTETARLTASDRAMYDRFGWSVAIDGDTVVVGAYGDDIDANIAQGSAYVFVKPGSGWANMTQTAKLTASDGAVYDHFGYSVAIDGDTVDTVVVGAGHDDIAQGSAYVFAKPAITVVPTSGLVTTEAGGTATFDVTAHTPPEDTVKVPLFSSDTTEGTVPADVVLPADSTAAVTITVTGAEDAILDGDVDYLIITGNPTSADAAYDALGSDDVADVAVTNQDDGEPVHVISTSPPANARAAACSTDVTATLDEYIAPATVNASTYIIHAGFSGVALGRYSIGSVVFDPATDLHPGELIETTVTSGVCTPSGCPATPYVWRFRTAVGGGYGWFTESVGSYGTSFSRRASLGDLDGDGDLDAFVANSGAGGAGEPNRVWLNDGDGTFTQSAESYGTFDSRDVSLGDLDGDGDLDAFVANGSGGGSSEPNRVWLNDGDGTFTQSVESYGISASQGLSLGDLDGDGDLDAFIAEADYGANSVWLNDGDGTFTQSVESYGVQWSWDVSLGDLDGDGDLDAFVANVFANRAWLNDGDGTFTPNGEPYEEQFSVRVSLGDLDGDGDLDAFVANTTALPPTAVEANRVWLNDGDGTFTESAESYGSSDSLDVAHGDLDGDGDLDAFIANSGVNRVWLNDGDGTFTQSGESYGNAVSYGIAVGDLDGDGDLDAFIANADGNRVWLNEDPASTSSTFRVGTAGDVRADGTFTATLFESPEADVAEWVTVSEPVKPGDVLELDPTTPGSYRLSSAANSSLIAGVVSTQPGVVLGASGDHGGQALLALTGIVPVKVTDEGGLIRPGDLLVTSSAPGHAMRWAGPEACPCALVGKALEPMSDTRGLILVLLTSH